MERMRQRTRAILAVTALLTLSTALPAQDETPTFKGGVSLIRVEADVTDGSRPVMGLTKESFRVVDNGTAREIATVTQEAMPLDLVLLFDVSGSMRPGIQRIAGGAREALQQLRAGDRVSVMVFTSRVETLLEFSDEVALMEETIRQDVLRQTFRGATYLREAIEYAGRAFAHEDRSERRRAILVITDNRGHPSGAHEASIIAALLDADVVVNGLILQTPGSSGQTENMNRIAAATGGELLLASSPAADFRDMIQRMRMRYSLYYPMPEGTPGEMREVRVELAPEARKGRSGVTIRSRRSYRLPAPKPGA